MGISTLPIPRPDAPLYASAEERIPDLARRTVAHCVAEVPFYAMLPRERVEGEITDLVNEHLRLFLRVLREGRLPTDAELAAPITRTIRRSGDSAPLSAVLTAYRIGGRLGWRELTRLAGPEDTEDLLVAGAYLLEYLQSITNAIATAYLEEEKAELAERRESRRALIQALLAGASQRELGELAERAAIPLASRYLVVSLRLTERQAPASAAHEGVAGERATEDPAAARAPAMEPPATEPPATKPAVQGERPPRAAHPPRAAPASRPTRHARHPPQEARASRGEPVATIRRRIGRIRDELDAYARTPVLSALDGRGGIALLPTNGPERDAGTAGLAALVDRIAEIAGGPIHAGVVEAATEAGQIPTAAEEAREIALIASRLGHPPGLYRLDDVLLEYQLTRPGPARERLARRLDPLAERATLLETLQTFLRLGNNRRRAAQELHVHPNTLDYRLRRVAAFTGLDPLVASDARLLAAALIARSLTSFPSSGTSSMP